MKKILFSFSILLIMVKGYSQVGINILTPDPSAALQVESNTKGVGLPQLTSAQMNAITAPLNGLTIFNTNDSVVEYWNGSCWLKAWEPNCYYCDFTMTITPTTDTLDRTISDSVFATVTITHTHGNQPITATWSAIPPSGVQLYSQGNTTIDSSGSFKIIVSASVFSGSGQVPILVTAYCGNQARFVTFNVYIKPCVQVNIVNDYTNYDVQALNSTLLPAGSIQCLLVTVNGGVTLHSADPTLPALTIGNLNPLSIVGLINNGAILGRGGDGGGFQATTAGGNPGQNGGDGLDLTTPMTIQNYGEIYAGGGGGGSVGYVYSASILGININLGIGAGGGGGSENGLGGTVATGTNLGILRPGNDATSTIYSVPGTGASITGSIPISVVTVSANVQGGNGGGFSFSGTAGSASIGIQVCVNVPFLGNICLPNPPYQINIPIGGAGGGPGLAIKRNGNLLTGIADGAYYGFQIKGTVGP